MSFLEQTLSFPQPYFTIENHGLAVSLFCNQPLVTGIENDGLQDARLRYLVITFALLLKTFINRSSPAGVRGSISKSIILPSGEINLYAG